MGAMGLIRRRLYRPDHLLIQQPIRACFAWPGYMRGISSADCRSELGTAGLHRSRTPPFILYHRPVMLLEQRLQPLCCCCLIMSRSIKSGDRGSAATAGSATALPRSAACHNTYIHSLIHTYDLPLFFFKKKRSIGVQECQEDTHNAIHAYPLHTEYCIG